MKQMDLLEDYLKEKKINYKRCDVYDGVQIIVYGEKGKRKWDAICRKASYGYERGLLEIMGNIVDEKRVGDRVEGWLTAQDVIDRVEGRL